MMILELPRVRERLSLGIQAGHLSRSCWLPGTRSRLKHGSGAGSTDLR